MDKDTAAENLNLTPAGLQTGGPAVRNRVDVSPDRAWLELNRRFRLLWILLLASLPGTFVSAWLLSGTFPPRASLAAIGLLWMIAVARAGQRVARFACPRCGLAFFESWVFLKMLRDRCAHCGLPRGPEDIASR